MAYSDQKFYTRVMSLISAPVSWGTATASATDGHDITDQTPVLPKFFRRTAVGAIRMRCTVIPNAASTAVKAHFLNGTSTFGVVTLTTATAGQILDGTVTSSNGTFTASGQPTVKLTGTATASAAANGSWEVWFETTELPTATT